MDVLNEIRKTNLKNALKSLIYVLLINVPLICVIFAIINEGFEGSMLFIVLLFGLIAIPIDISFIKMLTLVIKPEKSDIFKKYGGIDKIQKIIDEIEKTKEYEDKNLIISKNYICDRKDLEKIVKCSDVLGVHKLVHKTNFVIDYYKIIITDKYGHETSYVYYRDQDKLCNELLALIGSKCKNAELGYTKDEWDHINKNRIDLPSESVSNNFEYKCPDCNNSIDYGDKFCKNCSCKLDWEEEQEEPEEFKASFKTLEEKRVEQKQYIKRKTQKNNILKYIGIGFLSIISSEMLLMILLGDSIEGDSAFIIMLVVAVPFAALYYYLFCVRKK